MTLFPSCQRDDNELVAIVRFETAEPALTGEGVQTGGRVTANREINFTEFGVCYSTSPNPTISDLIAPGSGLETGWLLDSYTIEFSSLVTGLTPGTTYYFRAFLTTRTGTAFGREVQFTP